MTQCKHESLEWVGEQRTDSGVNTFYRCKHCNDLIVTTPEKSVYRVPGVQGSRSASEKPTD